jgi:GMP synthase-like glutamine amidotransferase
MTESPCFTPTILQRTIGDQIGKSIELLFLGCEENAPYGPYHHTATLFLNLICRALESCATKTNRVTLKVYSVSQGNFPASQDFETCDGVILPGSFSSAYNSDSWILQLKEVIQNELVANRRKTMGVCFGHQLYSHSFEQGEAVKCRAGPQAGRKTSKLTEAGLKWLSKTTDNLDLFYTHGDMVDRLPPQGLSLGGNDKVPIQSAIYFCQEPKEDGNNEPIAITFQAHPEYASSRELGLEQTLVDIMEAMEKRGDLTTEDRQTAEEDAAKQFENVESDSIQVMIAVGKTFGWF